jgi:hypothetical protein
MPIRRLIVIIILTGMPARMFAQTPHRFDVVIDEIFPDPSPQVKLPHSEFIEIRNVSSNVYNLRNWQMVSGGTSSVIKTDYLLMPDSVTVICATAAENDYEVFGNVITISKFPSLNNDGDTILLLSPEGETIHSVIYDKTWYHNELKSQGGWTLEMIDFRNPCSGEANWTASLDERGGTPGKINSVNGINHDGQPPSLLRTFSSGSNSMVLMFSEPLDSSAASQADHYRMEPMGPPILALPLPPQFSEVLVEFAHPLDERLVYTLTTSGITDCAGNFIEMLNTARAALPLTPAPGDLVINEILFNPAPNGYDYLELYNRSHKTIDLHQVYLANRQPDGGLKNIVPISTTPYLFFPGDFDVITENSLWVEQNYVVRNTSNMIEISSLPSMPDDEGDIVVLDGLGTVIDELHYHHQWHFALISNEEGVALERIDYNSATQEPSNWTSAASNAGFGTPTYQNAEFRTGQSSQSGISVSPKLFSPDHDGFEDDCLIDFKFSEPGYTANITVFDAAGRPVRYLVQNATLSASGHFRWDGLDDTRHRLPVGIYIVFTEVFTLKGETKRFKNAVTIAGKMR